MERCWRPRDNAKSAAALGNGIGGAGVIFVPEEDPRGVPGDVTSVPPTPPSIWALLDIEDEDGVDEAKGCGIDAS